MGDFSLEPVDHQPEFDHSLQPVEYDPFAAEKFANPAVQGAITSLATLPQRAIQNSQNSLDTGTYDPGPTLEAATLPMGTGAIAGVPVRGGEAVFGSGFVDKLYHGSPVAGLDTLKASERGPLGPGTYTTPFDPVATRYAGDAGTVYELPEKTRDIFNGLGDRYGQGYEGWKADKERLLAAAEPEKREAISQILDKSWMSDGYPTYTQIRNLYGGHEGAQELFKRAGFEGLSGHVDGPEVLLFGDQKLVPVDHDPFSSGAVRSLPQSGSLNLPRAPTSEELTNSGRVESVPLSETRATQPKMQWDRFNKGEHPPPIVKGFEDKPVAVRKENGEYLIFDGHHRTANAINAGKQHMDMYVVDAKAYDPSAAGLKPNTRQSVSYDDLLKELGVSLKPVDHDPFK